MLSVVFANLLEEGESEEAWPSAPSAERLLEVPEGRGLGTAGPEASAGIGGLEASAKRAPCSSVAAIEAKAELDAVGCPAHHSIKDPHFTSMTWTEHLELRQVLGVELVPEPPEMLLLT